MQKTLLKSALLVLIANLTACSGYMPSLPGMSAPPEVTKAEKFQKGGMVGATTDQTGKEVDVNVTMTGGGEIGLRSMDSEDKNKMSRALDAGTGKATHWENAATGVSYTVTPIKKVVVENNPFCRLYQVVVTKGSNEKVISGTACVTTDGGWHTI